MRTKIQKQKPQHGRTNVYKITCKTCHKTYIGQTNRILKLRFQEHVRYIKNNDPRSAYAIHIHNFRHEYGNVNDTMTLLKRINNPPCYYHMSRRIYSHSYRNNKLVPEQHPSECNLVFELFQAESHTSQTNKRANQ